MSLKWLSLSKLQKKTQLGPLQAGVQDELFSASEMLLSSAQVSAAFFHDTMLQLSKRLIMPPYCTMHAIELKHPPATDFYFHTLTMGYPSVFQSSETYLEK